PETAKLTSSADFGCSAPLAVETTGKLCRATVASAGPVAFLAVKGETSCGPKATSARTTMTPTTSSVVLKKLFIRSRSLPPSPLLVGSGTWGGARQPSYACPADSAPQAGSSMPQTRLTRQAGGTPRSASRGAGQANLGALIIVRLTPSIHSRES